MADVGRENATARFRDAGLNALSYTEKNAQSRLNSPDLEVFVCCLNSIGRFNLSEDFRKNIRTPDIGRFQAV